MREPPAAEHRGGRRVVQAGRVDVSPVPRADKHGALDAGDLRGDGVDQVDALHPPIRAEHHAATLLAQSGEAVGANGCDPGVEPVRGKIERLTEQQRTLFYRRGSLQHLQRCAELRFASDGGKNGPCQLQARATGLDRREFASVGGERGKCAARRQAREAAAARPAARYQTGRPGTERGRQRDRQTAADRRSA